MTLKAIIAKIEDAPEADRGHYAEITEGDHKGKFLAKVDAVDGHALEDVTGLRTMVQDLRKKRDAQRRRADEFVKHFEDPEAAREARERLDAAGDDDGGGGGKGGKGASEDAIKKRIADATKQLQAKHDKEKAELDALLTSRTDQLKEELVDNRVLRLLPDGTKKKMVLSHLREVARPVVNEDTGKYDVKVFGEGGETPLMSQKQGSTSDMQLEEYVKDVLPKDNDWSSAFPGTGATGGGATGSGSGGAGGATSGKKDTSSLPAVERLKIAMREEAAAG